MQTQESAVRAPGHTHNSYISPASLSHSPRSRLCPCLSAPHTVQPQGSVSMAGLSPQVDLPSQVCWLPAHSPAKNSTWDERESPRMRGKHSHLVWEKAVMWSCRWCPAQGTGTLLPGDAEKSGDTEASLSSGPSWPELRVFDLIKEIGRRIRVPSHISPSLSAEVWRCQWFCPASLDRIAVPLETPSLANTEIDQCNWPHSHLWECPHRDTLPNSPSLLARAEGKQGGVASSGLSESTEPTPKPPSPALPASSLQLSWEF